MQRSFLYIHEFYEGNLGSLFWYCCWKKCNLMVLFQSELDWSVLESLGRSSVPGRQAPLQKQETKRIDGGSLIASPMLKSVIFGGREDQLLKE